MCLACEEEELFYRYQLELAVERGVIPEGFTAEDFEAAGLPVPGRRKTAPAKPPKRGASIFTCDAPGDE
jgi:hypothetical protein